MDFNQSWMGIFQGEWYVVQVFSSPSICSSFSHCFLHCCYQNNYPMLAIPLSADLHDRPVHVRPSAMQSSLPLPPIAHCYQPSPNRSQQIIRSFVLSRYASPPEFPQENSVLSVCSVVHYFLFPLYFFVLHSVCFVLIGLMFSLRSLRALWCDLYSTYFALTTSPASDRL